MAEPQPPQPPRQSDRIAKGIRIGLMAGSVMFLGARYLLKVDVDPALMLSAFVGVAAGIFVMRASG